MKAANGFKAQAQLFRALSHPVRLRILDILSQQEACVCHLTEILGQRQPYVSQQLAALRDAGLVADRRDGTLIYYRLAGACARDTSAGDHLARLMEEGKTLVRDLNGEVLAFPPAPPEVLESCPCPRCQGEG